MVVLPRPPDFLTTVVEVEDVLWLLAALAVRGDEDVAWAGRGGGAIVPSLAVFSLDAVRVILWLAAPADLTMPCTEAKMALLAVLSGEAGFRGEVGRAM